MIFFKQKLLSLSFLSLTIFSCSQFSKAKKDFISDINLVLTGKVTNIINNNYGQKIVCLDVLESNHDNYFPIHNPNKHLKEKDSIWKKRFFVKVEGKRAIFIYDDNINYRHINRNIIKGAIITINEDNKKSYRIYDNTKSKKFGGLSIQTYPIRDNVDISCLGKGFK